MPGCKHQSLEFVGEQKTDDGVNTYYTCKACGMFLVVTPASKVVGIPPAKLNAPHMPASQEPRS